MSAVECSERFAHDVVGCLCGRARGASVDTRDRLELGWRVAWAGGQDAGVAAHAFPGHGSGEGICAALDGHLHVLARQDRQAQHRVHARVGPRRARTAHRADMYRDHIEAGRSCGQACRPTGTVGARSTSRQLEGCPPARRASRAHVSVARGRRAERSAVAGRRAATTNSRGTTTWAHRGAAALCAQRSGRKPRTPWGCQPGRCRSDRLGNGDVAALEADGDSFPRCRGTTGGGEGHRWRLRCVADKSVLKSVGLVLSRKCNTARPENRRFRHISSLTRFPKGAKIAA